MKMGRTTRSPLPLSLIPLILMWAIPVRSDRKVDEARLGSELTSMPLYRSGAGTNVLRAAVGTPGVTMDLTCSTNVDFLIVAATGCEECVQNADLLPITDSSSLTISQQDLAYTFPYPAGTSDTISIAGRSATEHIMDERADDGTARPVVLAAAVQANDPEARLDGPDVRLTDGTAGFWGMGVYQADKTQSMIPSVITANNGGPVEQLTSFTVGFEINNYSRSTDKPAGTVHWGAVPGESYEGEFNWLATDREFGGSWAFDLDRMRIGGEVIDLESNFGTVDPGFDAIYVPTTIAERFFSTVSGATRDLVDTTRWNIPCDTSLELIITISGVPYAVASSQLVQARDTAGRTCWGSVVAWQNGSVPEQRGEVRLGTPFMAGVYTALYYSDSEQFVGLAGKPNSVNAHNLFSREEGKPNMQLAGILIGTLLGALIILVLLCYAQNRNSFQSIWYRAIRRQQRAQMDAVVRGATLPPVVPVPMGMPMAPPMMGMGMGPPPVMGMGGPMAPLPMGGPPGRAMFAPPALAALPGAGGRGGGGGGGYPPAPPPYQQPITRDPPHQLPPPNAEQSQPLLPGGMPMTHAPQPQGYYSPRLQPTSPPRSNGLFPLPMPFGRGRRGGSRSSQTGYGRPPGQWYEAPAPPVSAGSKVHFGPAGARFARSASTASVNEFGGFGRSHDLGGPAGRQARQDEFLRNYAAAAGQHENPGGSHQSAPAPYDPPEYAAAAGGAGYVDSLPPLAEVPEGSYHPHGSNHPHGDGYDHVGGAEAGGHYSGGYGHGHGRGHGNSGEKKRYFAWGGKGYEAVHPQPSPAGSGGDKRRSWWGGRKDVEAGLEYRERRGLGWS